MDIGLKLALSPEQEAGVAFALTLAPTLPDDTLEAILTRAVLAQCQTWYKAKRNADLQVITELFDTGTMEDHELLKQTADAIMAAKAER